MSIDTAERSEPVYVYKPSLMGAPWEFRLLPGAIEWRIGRLTGRTPLRDITRVRLSYRPVTMQARRFVTEIWAAGSPRLSIASASWKGMLEMQANEAAYGAFVRELHRRIAAADVAASFETGSSPLLYWPGLLVGVMLALAMTALTLHALATRAWAGAAFVGGFLLLLLWQSGGYFLRNRPGRYRPDELPERLLPAAAPPSDGARQ